MFLDPRLVNKPKISICCYSHWRSLCFCRPKASQWFWLVDLDTKFQYCFYVHLSQLWWGILHGVSLEMNHLGLPRKINIHLFCSLQCFSRADDSFLIKSQNILQPWQGVRKRGVQTDHMFLSGHKDEMVSWIRSCASRTVGVGRKRI